MFRPYKPTWDPRGFWALKPMPSPAVLDSYYRNTYWNQRGGHIAPVYFRDLDHYLTIAPYVPAVATFRFLNFGAGHGGASHLMFAQGADVTNVEPGGMDSQIADQRWQVVETIDQADGQFDMIYGSHSLEHVQDLDAFMASLDSKLKPGGLIFFEVPNCRRSNCADPLNGGQNGKVVPPHTYYFTMDYFRGLPFNTIVLGTFNHGKTSHGRYVQQPDEDGPVIRYFARK
jgi:SAM-dependent methyltransferase